MLEGSMKLETSNHDLGEYRQAQTDVYMDNTKQDITQLI